MKKLLEHEDELLTPKETSLILKVSKTTLNRWAECGYIKYIVLPSGIRRYLRSNVEKLLEPFEKKGVCRKRVSRREMLEKKLFIEGIMK